jgi:hypothetical protein
MQHFGSGEDLGKGWRAIFRHTIPIVQFFRTVNAQANQEVVLLEKGSAIVVE